MTIQTELDAKNVVDTLEPKHEGNLRLGIFLDRVSGTAFAVFLNSANNKFAPLTVGEHAIKSDDFDGIFDAVNEVCEDIQRWQAASESEISGAEGQSGSGGKL